MSESGRDELVEYRLRRAKETVNELDVLVQNKFWNTAVNRMYYACFYSVTALLSHSDIHVQTHSGARQMFGQKFVKTGLLPRELGKLYSDLFDLRTSGDYDDFIDIREQDVRELIDQVKHFVTEIDKLIQKND